MSKRFVAFTIALAAVMTVVVLALTAAPPAVAGPCLLENCSDCPQTIVFPNGVVCQFDHCILPPHGCKPCQYVCQF